MCLSNLVLVASMLGGCAAAAGPPTRVHVAADGGVAGGAPDVRPQPELPRALTWRFQTAFGPSYFDARAQYRSHWGFTLVVAPELRVLERLGIGVRFRYSRFPLQAGPNPGPLLPWGAEGSAVFRGYFQTPAKRVRFVAGVSLGLGYLTANLGFDELRSLGLRAGGELGLAIAFGTRLELFLALELVVQPALRHNFGTAIMPGLLVGMNL